MAGLDAAAAQIHRWGRRSGGQGADPAARAQIQAAGNGSSGGSSMRRRRERRTATREKKADAICVVADATFDCGESSAVASTGVRLDA
ncbi:hypothetical protein GUJ93_ZPchr0013g37399 [Zizania palustris]|uniref:Uncharacterized protein n=1 Tax=Zizania palustris TaxID=103762 RepID=A0A8J5X527_ZIZPA|nr:hypothetical protein GUJ93_ZPchr0013g37399 [Zizania palustris]